MDPKIPLTDLCAFSHHGGIRRRDCRGHAEQPRLRGPEPLRRGARTTSRGHSPRVSRLLAATLEPAGSDPRRTEPPRIDPGSATLTGTGPRAPVEGGVCSVYGDPQWIVVLKVRRRVPAGGQTCPRALVSRCFRHVYLQLPEVRAGPRGASASPPRLHSESFIGARLRGARLLSPTDTRHFARNTHGNIYCF